MKILEDLHAFLWTDPSMNNCNTYFINSPHRILIDPGHEDLFSHVREKLAELALSTADIDLVLITHAHPDHLEGARIFSEGPALIAIHHEEMTFSRQMAAQLGTTLAVSPFEPDILLQEGDLQVGSENFRVIHSPGHSPGSVCLYWAERRVLFSGDVIFNQGVGRTDLPGGDGSLLKDSIRALTSLDVEILLPGHGDIIRGRDRVRANFDEIERVWFAYL